MVIWWMNNKAEGRTEGPAGSSCTRVLAIRSHCDVNLHYMSFLCSEAKLGNSPKKKEVTLPFTSFLVLFVVGENTRCFIKSSSES